MTPARWIAAAAALLAVLVVLPMDRTAPPTPRPLPPAPLTSKGPVGWDVYRRLDLLPFLTRGVETRQFSSFDRTGGNADFSHCLRQAPDGCVLAERTGPGEVDAMWFTRDFGDVSRTGAIKIELDGRTVVYAPLRDLVDGALGAPFVFPLVADATRSSGGNTVDVPMPFRESMRIVTDADPIYYQVTYRVFADAVGVRTFDPRDRALDVVAELRRAGAADPGPEPPGARTVSGSMRLGPGTAAALAALDGPGEITALRLRTPGLAVPDSMRLRLAFDGERTVDAPLGQFFGSGLGARVAGLLFAMDAGSYAAWWPMPFGSRAAVELENLSPDSDVQVEVQVTWVPDQRWTAWLGPSGGAGTFRADSHAGAPAPGVDYALLDALGAGKLVGVSATLDGPRSRQHLEGDERIAVDGSRTPQLSGTGTEDFFRGGWYFDHGTFSDPLAGEPAHRVGTGGCPRGLDCTDAYRTLLGAAVPFASSIAFGIEHGGTDDVAAAYSSTAFWYGRDRPSLQLDDVLTIGDAGSERAHAYATGAVRRTTLTATYEGNDGPAAPATAAVDAATGPVRFVLTTAPANGGLVLVRTSDQRRGEQSATVLVDGHVIGVWLEPLANPDHRWLDDSFPLPASLTAGARRLRVTLIPTPGAPPWTAARYEVLSLDA